MGDVLTFTPRARPTTDDVVYMGQRDVRASLEEAVQAALDTADRLIAVLDGMDGEEGGAASIAPGIHIVQVVRLRAEATTPAVDCPDLQIKAGVPLPWSGRGNVFTAIGGALLDLAGTS